MKTYYLAVDIGASSGRHILGSIEGGKISLEEIYRFENGIRPVNGQLCWDLQELFQQVKKGLHRCKEINKIPSYIGIDTWAVDFVLLDLAGQVLGNTVSYRDMRTNGMDELVYSVISEKDLYARTGIQKQIFNTIYQLMAVKVNRPEILNKADTYLMIPDYLNYLLCGVKSCEYTNATTTQLVSPLTGDWDRELIRQLGYPEDIFPQIREAGDVLGGFQEEIAKEVGFNCTVILPGTHDTASAVLAVPAKERPLYISSGTWSLMGTELEEADCSEESRTRNFTNEGGYGKRFRYLKNIMGLWMIQSVRKEIGEDRGYEEICEMACVADIDSRVNCNDSRFLSPKNMTEEIQKFCAENGQMIPKGIAQVAAVIYNSLAECYRDTVKEIEEYLGICFDRIHIVGGGANADYLNRLTAEFTGKTVLAGPTEATAIGNLLAQMISTGEIEDVEQAREMVKRSFDMKEYKP